MLINKGLLKVTKYLMYKTIIRKCLNEDKYLMFFNLEMNQVKLSASLVFVCLQQIHPCGLKCP